MFKMYLYKCEMNVLWMYRKSSNKDRDSIRGRASDSSRGRGRYGQIKAGPRIQAGGKRKVGLPVAYFTVAYQHQSISTKQTSQFNLMHFINTCSPHV